MDEFDWLPGDLVACYGNDWTGKVISCLTASIASPKRLRFGPSHVAVMCEHHGRNVWVESTTLCPTPCLIQGKRVTGAQVHRPEDRIQDYVRNGGRVDLYRLTPINRLLPEESRLLTTILIEQFIRNPSDYDLVGAILSGTKFLQATRFFSIADLNETFCSELVSAVMMRLNRMNHANPAKFHPAHLMRTLVRSGKYQWKRSWTAVTNSDVPQRPLCSESIQS